MPRTLLPRVFKRIAEIAAKYNVRIVNVAHAGDGNVHPILLFDPHLRRQTRRTGEEGQPRGIGRVYRLRRQRISAEHGVGVEKLALADGAAIRPGRLRAMHRVRSLSIRQVG